MPDLSNPTTRVMDVLNFLAARPTEAFTLAEIAKHVGLTNGSAHRLLTTMAAGQFLSRHEKHRTYSLGVAMVALGQAAIEKHRGIEIARREIARLAIELDVQCSASAVVDGDILVLVKEGAPRSPLGLTRVGERRPLMPPVGLCFVAWAGENAIKTYIDSAAPHLSDKMRKHLLKALPLIRERGFALAAGAAHAGNAREAMATPTDQVRDATYWARVFATIAQLTPNEIQVFDPAEAAIAGVSYIAAPVFSATGDVAFQLVLSGIPVDLSARDIERFAARLRATAALITSESHGRPPAVS